MDFTSPRVKSVSKIERHFAFLKKLSYDTIIKLIDLGITPEELFGEASGKKLRKNASPSEMPEIDDELALKVISRGLELLLARKNSTRN
jgi:hypothetical protein